MRLSFDMSMGGLLLPQYTPMSRGWPPMMTLAVTASTSSQLQDKQKESTVNRSGIGQGQCHTQEDALVVCMPIDWVSQMVVLAVRVFFNWKTNRIWGHLKEKLCCWN